MADDLISNAAQEAFDAYRRSLGNRFEPAPAAYAAGRVRELIGDPKAALEEYLKALSELGAEAWPRLLNGIVRCAKNCHDEEKTARLLAQRAVTDPPMPDLSIISGHLFRSVGRHSDALEILRACIPSIGDRASRYWATRELLAAELALGHIEVAINVVREAISSHPDHEGDLRADLAGLLASRGLFEDALAEAQQAVACDPGLAIAQFVLGASLLRLDRREDALLAFDEAKQLDVNIGSWVTELLSEVG